VIVLPGLAALIAAGFSAAVLVQYRSRRRPYQAAWGAALAMFAIAAGAEAAGAGGGWSANLYKVYYLFGALLNVGWLAVGTIFVLRMERTARAAVVVMGLLSLLSLVAVATASVDAARLHATLPERASTVPAVLPAVINGLGTVILVGGAAWSAWQTFRRHAPAGRVIGLACIAGGALLLGTGHTIAVTAGIEILRPICEAIGIAVMCVGYLAVEAQRAPAGQPQAA